VLVNGIPALGDGAHQFADQLPEADQWAVVAYVRSLAWENAGEALPAAVDAAPAPLPSPPEPLPRPPANALTVRGAVQMGTPAIDIGTATRYAARSGADGEWRTGRPELRRSVRSDRAYRLTMCRAAAG
jgi:hypothetical protein